MKNKELHCVFCGVQSKTTRDHIPPQNLFPKPRPNSINLLTVPSCFLCNNNSSNDDEYFLYFILMGLDENEGNKEFIKSTVKKLYGKKFLYKLLNNFIDNYPIHENGIYTGSKTVWRFDRNRIKNVMDKIVKNIQIIFYLKKKSLFQILTISHHTIMAL